MRQIEGDACVVSKLFQSIQSAGDCLGYGEGVCNFAEGLLNGAFIGCESRVGIRAGCVQISA
ncbi:MAG TPA: hypothetical protein DEB28_18215, partial [Hyphomonas sp.]|nr:hypothetical protein [Hyphomonas sp.]HBN93747.1 hypothetical protein [Hyphomonas sp.]HBU36066.1 hypothetical protein [Hyphomonas sp.]HBX98196.1 hypothetical protein [Hyphomonas sp.]